LTNGKHLPPPIWQGKRVREGEQLFNCEGVSILAEISSFQKVEGMLYSYFDAERRLELLENALEGVSKEIDDIPAYG